MGPSTNNLFCVCVCVCVCVSNTIYLEHYYSEYYLYSRNYLQNIMCNMYIIEAEVINICVGSDIGVDLLTGVDANVLRVMMTALGFIAVSALLE